MLTKFAIFLVSAILTFGDTRHTADAPGNYESGKSGNGLFPRPGDQMAKLEAFSDRHRDYCVNTDPICSGADSKNPEAKSHLTYFDRFTDEAAKFVKEKLGGDIKKSDPSKTTAPPVASTDVTSASGSASVSVDPTSGATSTISNLPASSTDAGPSSPANGAAQNTASDKPDNAAGIPLAPLGLVSAAFAAGVAILMG